MKIDQKTLVKIAHLARLEFDPKDAEAMMQDMTKILNWVEQLNTVNTDDVAPLTTMSHEINVLREDEPGVHLSKERALKQAPHKDSDYFRVPKVLE